MTRPERVIVYMAATIVGISVLAIVALLIAAAAGAAAQFGAGIWPAVRVLPLLGFPIGVLLIIVFLVLNAVRRSRAAKGASQ